MSEKKTIHLVLTCVPSPDCDGKKAWAEYKGEYDQETCPMKVSFRGKDGSMFIPLWFDDEAAAKEYQAKIDALPQPDQVFLLVQEFIYRNNVLSDEAKIIFAMKSDIYPTLEEGNTERRPGIWAHVRSLFICDRQAALDYVARFNKDSADAHEVSRKK